MFCKSRQTTCKEGSCNDANFVNLCWTIHHGPCCVARQCGPRHLWRTCLPMDPLKVDHLKALLHALRHSKNLLHTKLSLLNYSSLGSLVTELRGLPATMQHRLSEVTVGFLRLEVVKELENLVRSTVSRD